MREGETLYLAGGAVINGSVYVEGDHAEVKGSGVIIMEDYPDQPAAEKATAVMVISGKHVRVEGVIAMQRRNWCWTTTLWKTEDVTLERYRVVSTPYASTDGINPCSSSQILIQNCFLRTCDDCIAIKGVDASTYTEQITVRNCTMWSDCNCIICIGAEADTKGFRNMTFQNLDVLFSYGDYLHQEELSERAVFAMMPLKGVWISDITYEDVRVNRCERLISMQFLDSFWFGTVPGDQSGPGGIRNITFRNITSPTGGTSSFSNEIQLLGYSDTKQLERITFEHVTVGGVPVMSDQSFLINRWVKELVFLP